jgi:prepilin-type processing-associated H-X9-DG protein
MDLRPAGGPWVRPTAFQWAGSSYVYNEWGLADRRTDWVRSPPKYVVLHEPTVLRSGGDEYSGRVYVYWHRARKPGSGNGLSDKERGPRVSPILFVDGHVEFVDCSFCYSGVAFRAVRVNERESYFVDQGAALSGCARGILELCCGSVEQPVT